MNSTDPRVFLVFCHHPVMAELFALTTCGNGSTKITPFEDYAKWFPAVYVSCASISLLLVTAGMVGNVLNILVLMKLRQSIPYRLMLLIAIFDSIRLVSNGVDFIFHLLEAMVDDLNRLGVEAIAYAHGLILVAKHTGSNASIYLLAFLSVLQVRSVKRPMARIGTRPVYLGAAALCLSQVLLCAPYAILTTAYYCPGRGRFKFHFTLEQVTLYRLYVEAILHTLLPTILVGGVSYSLLREIRKANSFRAGMPVVSSSPLSVSRAVLKLNLIFLACNIPHSVYIALYIYRLVHGAGFGLEVKNMIVVSADCAACINSGVNFLIYWSTDHRFRSAYSNLWRRRSKGAEISISKKGGSTCRVRPQGDTTTATSDSPQERIVETST